MVDAAGIAQATLLGLQIGMALILVVAGLTLIFGMMDVVNVAHGSLYALGAYFGVVVVSLTGSFWLALVVAPLVVALVGAVVEIFTIRPLQGRNPLHHILLTFGLLIISEEAIQLVWGSQIRTLDPPALLTGSFVLGSFSYPMYRVFLIVASGAVVVALWLVLSRTDFGILMQASGYDAEMVSALGIDVSKVFTSVFAIGAGLAGLAGVLLGAQQGFGPTTGAHVIIEAFAIVVIGGLGSFRGAVVGALLVGMLQSYFALFVPPLAELSVFLLMVLVLLVKPTGLYGEVTA